MKRILAVLLFLVGSQLFARQDTVHITFEVTAAGLSFIDTVYVAGNHPSAGNWMPAAVPLKKINDSTWTATLPLPAGYPLEYKFTKGSWAAEALAPDSTISKNNRLKAVNDTTVFHKISLWSDRVKVALRGQITGHVEYHKNIKYKSLLTRDVIVWLPPNYEDNPDERYAVLYMHDGKNIIDPATSTLGIDWQVDEAADSLIRKGDIEPFIVVGINNTAHRRSEYSNNDTGAVYMELIVNKVKPMIDSLYRTKPGREHTAVAGSSMGGLISLMLLWEYNDVFSKAVCMSPAFKVMQYDYVKIVKDSREKRDIMPRVNIFTS